MKLKTSYGYDEIPTKILKASVYNIISPLTHIINRSLMTGIVPDQLKIAKILPIYKAADSKLLKNYRPISLLPALSKVYEKIMFNKIMSYLNSNNILYKHQYGFRAKFSTIQPIIHLLNDCAIASNNTPKESTLSVLCDLSKAFDVINHKILFRKLDYYGIRGLPKLWIQNYLTNRTQYVDIENTKSCVCNIECGVPQGSVLGPLLYLIYVNDIANCTKANILSFADDTTLYISDQDPNELFRRANFEMNNLFKWFCANKLSLNPVKTKYIIIHPPQMKMDMSQLTLKVNGVELKQIGNNEDEISSKFLGVHFDEHLTWKNHINHVNTKISRALFAIKQIKHILPIASLRTLYYAMIHPHISYGLLAWGNASQTNLNCTIILQKRAIRTINRAPYNAHTEPLFKKSKILKLADLYEYEAIQFMFKYHTNKLPLSFNGMFRYNRNIQTNYQTRQTNLMFIERCYSAFSSRLPRYNFPKIWNNLNAITDNVICSQFRKKVRATMINSYADKIKCQNQLCSECH